jgi:hypothetical protein
LPEESMEGLSCQHRNLEREFEKILPESWITIMPN